VKVFFLVRRFEALVWRLQPRFIRKTPLSPLVEIYTIYWLCQSCKIILTVEKKSYLQFFQQYNNIPQRCPWARYKRNTGVRGGISSSDWRRVQNCLQSRNLSLLLEIMNRLKYWVLVNILCAPFKAQLKKSRSNRKQWWHF